MLRLVHSSWGSGRGLMSFSFLVVLLIPWAAALWYSWLWLPSGLVWSSWRHWCCYRPVLKHGPRSLTCVRVFDCNSSAQKIDWLITLKCSSAAVLILWTSTRRHICWDPKDGELCLCRMKPGETLVEVREYDVQIVHRHEYRGERLINHLVAGSLWSFPQDSWNSLSTWGKANDWRIWVWNILGLLSNFKCAWTSDCLIESGCRV